MSKVKGFLFAFFLSLLVCYLIDQATGLSKFEELKDKPADQPFKIQMVGPVVCLER